MAAEISYITINIDCDELGIPQSARVDYAIKDGALRKDGGYKIDIPDFSKILHNTGAVGEFYRDEVDVVKAREGL